MARKFETGWRLFPRVGDIGFFNGLLVSRRRLATAAVMSTSVSLAVIWAVSGWMRTTSGSPMVNLIVIALMLTGLIVSAYIDALLVGDLFFPGRWRDRVRLGEEFVAADWEEEEAAVKEYNAPFLMIVIVLVLALFALSQVVSRGFLTWYQNVGFALTLMRSDDPEERHLGIESIVNPLYEEQWNDEELHTALANRVDDDDDHVQQIALYAAGRLGVAEAGPTMVEVFRYDDNSATRASAAQALGRLGWERSLAYLTARVRAKDADSVEVLGILRGLAMMEDERGGGAVTRLLSDCKLGGERLPEDVIVNGFYALRQMTYAKAAPVALEYLNLRACAETVAPAEQCAAADALRYVSEKAQITELQRAFDAIPSDQVCDFAMWKYREEKAIEIVEKEPLRAKLIRSVGNLKDYDTYEWMWAVGADEDENPKTRKVAEIYVREMLAAYKSENPK